MAYNGRTGLSLACDYGHVGVVRELLGHSGVDVNAADPDGRTSLMWACHYGKVEIVRELLNHPEVDVNAMDCDGWTCLMLACQEDHLDVVSELVASGRVDGAALAQAKVRALTIGRKEIAYLLSAALRQPAGS